MGNFFASLRQSHALRWLLIWGVVILVVILVIRHFSEKHAAANGMTTSGSGLDGTLTSGGGASDTGSNGGFGSSTNINISITDAINNAFARFRRQPPPNARPPIQSGGGAIHPVPGQRPPSPSPTLRPMPPQHQPPAVRPPVPGVHRQPPTIHPVPAQHMRGHVGPPPTRPAPRIHPVPAERRY